MRFADAAVLILLCSAALGQENDEPFIAIRTPGQGEVFTDHHFPVLLTVRNYLVPGQGQACVRVNNAFYVVVPPPQCFSNLETGFYSKQAGKYTLIAYLQSNTGEIVAQAEPVDFWIGMQNSREDNLIFDLLIRQTLHGTEASNCHTMTLFGLVMQRRAVNILELGTRYGDSTLPLLLAANYTDGNVLSVDINTPLLALPPTLEERWSFVKSDAIAFLDSVWEDHIWDLVWIDDYHSYPHVKRELELLERQVNKSTVIVMHDCMAHSFPDYTSDTQFIGTSMEEEFADGGPWRAVRELDPEVWEWSTLPTCHGMTVVRKKV